LNYIVDDIEAVVELMKIDSILKRPDVYYMYGHKVEIAARLTEKDQDKVYKHQKYPLVALRMDFPETWNDGLFEVNLNIAIVQFTEKADYADKRYDKVFRTELYPLYESFMRQLNNVGLFTWESNLEKPPHTKIDRPFWGTPDDQTVTERNAKGNEAYIFNDPLDAIEIVNLRMKRMKTC
jgi:hypothetical protein